MPPERIARTTSDPDSKNQFPDSKKKTLTSNLVTGLPVLLAVGQLAYNKYCNQAGLDTSTIERSTAVLPFKNLSGNLENEPFCDGMTDEIIKL